MSLELVAPPERDRVEALVNGPVSELFDIDWSQVLHLQGGSAANGDNSDPIVLQGSAEAKMRRIITEFGFERLPLTFGEFHGLLDYCLMLDGVSTRSFSPEGKKYEEAIRRVQETGIRVWSELYPQHVPAMRLYCNQDRAGLKRLHREQDTLTVLGKTYKQFDE